MNTLNAPFETLLERQPKPPSVQELVSLDELERRYIELVMTMVNGNKTRAARLLGLDRTTLYRKLDRYRVSGEREMHVRPRLDGLPNLTGLL